MLDRVRKVSRESTFLSFPVKDEREKGEEIGCTLKKYCVCELIILKNEDRYALIGNVEDHMTYLKKYISNSRIHNYDIGERYALLIKGVCLDSSQHSYLQMIAGREKEKGNNIYYYEKAGTIFLPIDVNRDKIKRYEKDFNDNGVANCYCVVNGKMTTLFHYFDKKHLGNIKEFMEKVNMKTSVVPDRLRKTWIESGVASEFHQDIYIMDYSEKSFILFGKGTFRYKDSLKEKGRFNKGLKVSKNKFAYPDDIPGGSDEIKGWVFPLKHFDEIIEIIS